MKRNSKYFQYTLNNENKAIYYYNQIIQLIEEKEEKEDNQDNIKEFDYSGMYNDLGILKERRNDYIGAEIAYKKAIYYSPNFLSALCNLAHIKILKGEIVEAKKLYLKAINSSNVTPEILYNYALFLSRYEDIPSAIETHKKSINIKPDFYHAYEALGLLSCQQEQFELSTNYYQIAIDILKNKSNYNSHITSFNRITFQKLIGIIPKLFFSKSQSDFIRKQYLINLVETLVTLPNDALSLAQPRESLGCSSLGYYLIYQGYNDIIPRQLHSLLYSKFYYSIINIPPITPYFNSFNKPTYMIEESSLNPLLDPLFKLNSFKLLSNYTNNNKYSKVKVGFLSAFFYHHSVGLLLQGVIKHLRRDIFHVTTIFVSNPPIDNVSKSIKNKSDNVVELGGMSLTEMKLVISQLNLDIIVFGEIGMDLDTYFLGFNRLAKKSVVFWGHAITSGILDYSNLEKILSLNNNTKEDNNRVSKLISSYDRGGPDYFVSSVLFENKFLSLNQQQQRYTERLILQEGMTTYFERPEEPLSFMNLNLPVSQSHLNHQFTNLTSNQIKWITQLPDKLSYLEYLLSSIHFKDKINSSLTSQSILDSIILENNMNKTLIKLYGVPQTLYKLSPLMLDCMKNVLQNDLNGFLVVPESGESILASKALENLLKTFGENLIKRVIFVRYMKGREYITLCALYDVVMDTFPVGGGRSSFEIFSTGTPIIMYYSGTSILQLTYGMYRTMGINTNCCVTYNIDDYVNLTIMVASNKTLNQQIRQEILQLNSKLYSNETVINEWEIMLLSIHKLSRPVPFIDNGLILPLSNQNHEKENIHKDILNDIKIINDNNFNLFDHLLSKDLLAFSIPYNIEPIRISDEIKLL